MVNREAELASLTVQFVEIHPKSVAVYALGIAHSAGNHHRNFRAARQTQCAFHAQAVESF